MATNKFLRQDGWFQQVDSASIVPSTAATGTGFLGFVSAIASGDIQITSGTTTLAISVTQGSSGTWYVSGGVTFLSTATAQNFFVKLWDGTTVIASASQGAPASSQVYVALTGVIASPAGNLNITATSSGGTNSTIEHNRSGFNADTYIYAVRIA